MCFYLKQYEVDITFEFHVDNLGKGNSGFEVHERKMVKVLIALADLECLKQQWFNNIVI